MSVLRTLTRPSQSILGIGYQLILRGADTGGGYELMRFVVPPGGGPPPHIHQLEDECFHVLAGRLTVLRGDDSLQATKGDTMHLPRGMQHAFRNDSDETADFLCWVAPGNLESFFAAFAVDWPADDPLPPPPAEENIQAMMQAAAEHEIEMLM